MDRVESDELYVTPLARLVTTSTSAPAPPCTVNELKTSRRSREVERDDVIPVPAVY